MEKQELRTEFERLFYPEDLGTVMESYKLVTDAAFEIVSKQRNKIFNSAEDIDCGHLFQMTVLKNLTVLKLAESLSYHNSINDLRMLNLHDPFVLSSIVRTQYEAFCNFNNIYRLSKSVEEKKFKYDLWVLSGLKYRQGFSAEQEQNIKKKEDERKQIIELKNSIRSSKIYLSLNEDSKENIEKAIKWKKWQVIVNEDKAYSIPWHEMLSNAGSANLLNGQYSFLSLNTHPSNVSVFQFKDMYSGKNDLPNSLLIIKLSKWLISFFIADYCYYFDDAKETFNKLPLMTQIIINQYNALFRAEKYRINESSKILN